MVRAKLGLDRKELLVAPKLSSAPYVHVSPDYQNKKRELELQMFLCWRLDMYLGDGREGTGDSDSIDSEAVTGRLSWRILESRAEEADVSLELDVRRRAAAADSSELLLVLPLVVDSLPTSKRSRSSSLMRSMIYLSGTSPSRPSLVPFHQSLDT